MPFAHVTMSGSSPKRVEANQSPVRPNPVITSSATNSTPNSRHTAACGLEVAGWWREHPAGTDHGLAEERGDAAGPIVLDRGAQRAGVVPRDLRHVLDQLAVARGVRRDPGERGARRVHAVVGLLAPDQHGALGLCAQLPVPAGHLRGGVDRVRAPAGEEDLRALDRCERRHALGERLGGSVREVAECGVRGELAHLGGDRIRDLGASPTDVAVPERGRGIEVAATGVVDRRRRPRRGRASSSRSSRRRACLRTGARSWSCFDGTSGARRPAPGQRGRRIFNRNRGGEVNRGRTRGSRGASARSR